jgi:hypothetical protein
MRQNFWNSDTISQMEMLAKNGFSAVHIAKAMGAPFTRCMISLRAEKLGLKLASRGVFSDRRSAICKSIGAAALWKVPEHTVWMLMRWRCNGKGSKRDTARYFGRGIRVCERWEESFENFYSDMGPRPSPKHTIERTDSNGNYEPSNCKWATMVEQANNRCNNRIVFYRGTKTTLRSAIRLAGDVVRKDTARRRLELGWSIELAVETPPEFQNKRPRIKEAVSVKSLPA